MANEEVEVQISNRVHEMGLSSLAEKALVGSTIKLYGEIGTKCIFPESNESTTRQIATALFLACDGHACISIPKVQRACGKHLQMKNIWEARKAIGQTPATAHEKLDSLCLLYHISNKAFLERAHHFITLFKGYYRPTTMAVTAFLVALQQNQPNVPLPLKELLKLTKATGCRVVTIRNAYMYLHKKIMAEQSK